MLQPAPIREFFITCEKCQISGANLVWLVRSIRARNNFVVHFYLRRHRTATATVLLGVLLIITRIGTAPVAPDGINTLIDPM
jgi:hypothetical protein